MRRLLFLRLPRGALLLLIFFLAIPAFTAAATITVCPSGCSFTNIQEAINNATDGDTIQVMSGTYPEVIEINRSVTLEGVDSGGGLPNIGMYSMPVAVTITAPDVTISGFWIHGASEHAMIIGADRTTVRGIFFSIHRPDEITDAVITGSGISCVEISDCQMVSSGVMGIFLQDSNNLVIRNNTISVNRDEEKTATGIYAYYTPDTGSFSDITIEENQVNGGPIDVSVMYRFENPPQPDISNIRVCNNRVEDSKTFGIYIGGNVAVNSLEEYEYHRHNVTVEGNTVTNYTIRQGIEVAWAESGSLSGNTVTNGFGGLAGLRLAQSTGFCVTDNTVSNCTGGRQVVGLDLHEVKDTHVSGNTMTANQMNFAYTPGGELTPNMAIDVSNIADGRPIYYYEGLNGLHIDESLDPACLILVGCRNAEVEGISPSGNDVGIAIFNCREVLVHDSAIHHCYNGVVFSMSQDCDMVNNTIDDCLIGTSMYQLSDCGVAGNRFSDNGGSINLYIASKNTFVSRNTIEDSNWGLWTFFVQNGTSVSFTENTLTGVDNPITLIASDFLSFKNNYILNFTQAGIVSRISRSDTFSGNIIDTPDQDEDPACIFLQNAVEEENETIYRGGNHTFTNNFFNAGRHVIIQNVIPSGPEEILIPRWFEPFNISGLETGDGEIDPCIWNTTKTSRKNIVGGPFLGGNYWAFPNGTGWSQTHPDRGDGFVGEPYIIDDTNADDLPLHLYEEEIPVTAPAVIDRPGRYQLTNDLVNSTATTAIRITSSDVSLNGAGHSLGGDRSLETTGIDAGNVSNCLRNITIRNLTVSGWATGVGLASVENGEISGCSATGNQEGIAISSSCRTLIANTSSSGNIPFDKEGYSYGGSGIMVMDSPETRILGADITGNGWGDTQPLVGGYGINLLNSSQSLISGCTIANNINTGVWSERSRDVTVQGNEIHHNSGNGGIFMVTISEDPLVNSTIADNVISGSGWGIWLLRERYLVRNNTVWDCGIGILLQNCQDATLEENRMKESECNLKVDGLEAEDYYHQIGTSNTVDERPVYYLVGQSGAVVDASTNAGAIFAIECQDLLIRDLSLAKNDNGILLYGSDHTTITNVTARGNSNGFAIIRSNSTHMERCSAGENKESGVWISGSNGVWIGHSETATNGGSEGTSGSGVLVRDCTALSLEKVNASQNLFTGIDLDNTGVVNIMGVTADGNGVAGIVLDGDHIQVADCFIRDNTGPGIGIRDSQNMLIWNNYLSNDVNVEFVKSSVNGSCWSVNKTAGKNIVNGPYLGGNYWATPDGTGWSQTHPDRGDGFCNEPYVIDQTSTDFLPLHTYEPPPADYSLLIYPGWNHVSVPKLLSPGNNTASILSSVNTGSHAILTYSGENGWRQLRLTDTLRPLDTFWIYSVSSAEVPLYFDHSGPIIPVTKNLSAGWNAVGFSDVTSTTAKNTLLAVKDKWVTAFGFDPLSQQFETSIINGATDIHSDQRHMLPGRGYWVFMNSPGILPALG